MGSQCSINNSGLAHHHHTWWNVPDLTALPAAQSGPSSPILLDLNRAASEPPQAPGTLAAALRGAGQPSVDQGCRAVWPAPTSHRQSHSAVHGLTFIHRPTKEWVGPPLARGIPRPGVDGSGGSDPPSPVCVSWGQGVGGPHLSPSLGGKCPPPSPPTGLP